MQKKTELNKRIMSVKAAAKEYFNIVKNINTKLFSTIVAVVMLIGSFGIVTKYYTLGYDVYYGDVNVGVISSKEEAIKAYNEAEADVTQCDCASLEYDLRFVMTIASVNALENSDIYRGIVQAAEGMMDCYSINIGAESLVKVNSEEDAQKVMELYAANYLGTVNEITTEYEIVSDSDIVTEIKSVEAAVEQLKLDGRVKVTRVEVTENNVEIPFTETVIEDETISAGLTVVVQEGVNGYGLEKIVNVYENDVMLESSETIVLVEIAPVEQIVRKGTGVMMGIAENSLPWPTDGIFTSEFGRRWGRNHDGIDIAAKKGTPIYAPCAGTVIFSDVRSGYGNYVMIDHGNGFVTTYAHMNSRNVTLGQTVNVGDQVGGVGTTGRVTGAHLHFEVLINGTPVDPMIYIAG